MENANHDVFYFIWFNDELGGIIGVEGERIKDGLFNFWKICKVMERTFFIQAFHLIFLDETVQENDFFYNSDAPWGT